MQLEKEIYLEEILRCLAEALMLSYPGSSMDFLEHSPEYLEYLESTGCDMYQYQKNMSTLKKYIEESRLLDEAPPFEDSESYRKLVDRQLNKLTAFKHIMTEAEFDKQMNIFEDMCRTQVMEEHIRIEGKKEAARQRGEVYKHNVKQTNTKNLFATAADRLEFVQSQLEGVTPTAYPPTLEGKFEMGRQMMEFYVNNDDGTVEDYKKLFRQGMADRLLWDKTRFEAGHHPEFASFDEMRDKYFRDIDITKGLKAVFQC